MRLLRCKLVAITKELNLDPERVKCKWRRSRAGTCDRTIRLAACEPRCCMKSRDSQNVHRGIVALCLGGGNALPWRWKDWRHDDAYLSQQSSRRPASGIRNAHLFRAMICQHGGVSNDRTTPDEAVSSGVFASSWPPFFVNLLLPIPSLIAGMTLKQKRGPGDKIAVYCRS